MAFLHALTGIMSLLLVVALGFVLARKGCFPPGFDKFAPRFVTNITLPPFLACTIIANIQAGSLAHMLYGAAAPALVMCLLFVIAWTAAKIMKVDKRHFGLFCACVSNPNTIFIGIPVNMALFGNEALPYVLLYYFASTTFFWTVGNYFISRDESASKKEAKAFHWRRIISPPLYGLIVGLLAVCFEIDVPEFIFRAASLVGELTTPLALLFIGFILQSMPPAKLRLGKDIICALFGRMVLSPVLMWLAVPFFALPELMGKVFVIQSSLPVLMQVAILSAYYETDPDFGSIMVSLSTCLCAVTVPVYMAIF